MTATIIAAYTYDAYGTRLDSSNTVTNIQYTGEQFDPTLGNYYLRARYYDPATGRFNRLDPFAGAALDPQSLHKYLFTHGDPVNGLDPFGTFTLKETGIVVSIITVLLGLLLDSLGSVSAELAQQAKTDFTRRSELKAEFFRSLQESESLNRSLQERPQLDFCPFPRPHAARVMMSSSVWRSGGASF